MCVCALQTKNQRLFTFDEINNMMLTNPHGAGIMWTDGKTVYYRKGYFDAKKFYDDYVAIKTAKTTHDVAIHARIGTGSNIDVANCHPFPITSVNKRLKSSHGTCDVGVMMNGIIGKSTKEFSDTAIYVRDNLKSYYDIDRRFFMHFNKRQNALFENEIHGNRFILMCKESTKLFGVGWSDYEGKAMVSNRHWIPKPASYYSQIYNYLDDYEYDSYDSYWSSERAKRFSKKKSDNRYKSYIDYLVEEAI